MENAQILVVEDEAIVALDIQSKLRSRGYEVPALASSGKEAVEMADALRPDLVLMDIQLEGDIDGVEAAEQIRDRFGTPVVYLTAYSDDRTLQRAKVAEPFGYLLKPFEERKLHAAIEIALYKSKIDLEKSALEERLRQAHKMEAIGELTTGVAFNFNNMLHGVVGHLDLALLRAPDELKPYLEAAEFDARRAAKLVQQLVRFCWPENALMEAVAPEDIAAEVVSLFRQILARKPGKEIEVLFRAGPDIAPVLGSASQLKQCLVNLCTNAQEALDHVQDSQSHTGRIELSVAMAPRTADGPKGAMDATDRYVVIEVADNGAGIDPDDIDRIFEPFFSTRKFQDTNQATGQGKGLGLAMAYSYIREHQGWIEVDSEPGAGAVFSIFLPATYSPVVTAPDEREIVPVLTPTEKADGSLPLQGTETVLVLADVDRFRQILTEMLEHNGYQVRIGIGVRDGLALVEHDPSIDLVIVDVSASGTSSSETVAQIVRIRPELKVLVVTGLARTGAPWKGAKGVLNKPFTTNELMTAVRSTLQ
jgi:signal transduction histidine kinase